MGLAGETAAAFSSGFTLTGTNVAGTTNPQGSDSAYFYGETGLAYDITIGAGQNIFNFVDNSSDSAIYTAGTPADETAAGTPDGEVIAIDSGTIVNAGMLNTYPLPPPSGTTNDYQETSVVVYVANTGTVINTGTIGDLATISRQTNTGTPPYAFAQWDHVGIASNGGAIENGSGGLVDGYNAVVTTNRGTFDNYGTLDATNDGLLTTWEATNHLDASLSTTVRGYADIHTYGDFSNYGYLLGQDFGVLSGGLNNVINDYAGTAVTGVTDFDGSPVHDGEISALILGSESPVLTGTFGSYDAINMTGSGSTVDLHAGMINGTFYLPVIVGPMEGGFNSGTNLSNTLIFDFGGLDAADGATLSAAIAGSHLSNAGGTYYSGAADIQGIHYQWEDFAQVELACFAAGTGIATPSGDVPVESLRAGDVVCVAGARPGVAVVRWVGHRRIVPACHPAPAQMQPVRIARGAFADGVPARPVVLSPDHSVFVDGVLIPIKHLANGSSIAPIAVAAVEYWHVELDRHDILIADGLPAESYLDTGNRTSFANGGATLRLHPDFAAAAWEGACAELVESGTRLLSVKRRLFARAGKPRPWALPALRVVAEGRALPCRDGANGELSYALPAGATSVRLMSRSWVPAWRSAGSLDQRRLGVRLFALSLDGARVGLDHQALAGGFHPVEQTAEGVCRWTGGDARIALPAGTRTVAFQVGDSARPAGRRAA